MAGAETEHLKLPLEVQGHVAVQNSIARGFEIIDEAIFALQQGGGGPGVTVLLHTEYRTISVAEHAAKQLVLEEMPTGNVLVMPANGPVQVKNVDYQVVGNVLSWAGFSLELLLDPGNIITLQYPYQN